MEGERDTWRWSGSDYNGEGAGTVQSECDEGQQGSRIEGLRDDVELGAQKRVRR